MPLHGAWSEYAAITRRFPGSVKGLNAPRALRVDPPQGSAEGPAIWARSATPMRAQFWAVSLIRSRFIGVSRSIGEPHTLHGMLLFLTSTVTSFSVCCPQPRQQIRRIVRSAAE